MKRGAEDSSVRRGMKSEKWGEEEWCEKKRGEGEGVGGVERGRVREGEEW